MDSGHEGPLLGKLGTDAALAIPVYFSSIWGHNPLNYTVKFMGYEVVAFDIEGKYLKIAVNGGALILTNLRRSYLYVETILFKSQKAQSFKSFCPSCIEGQAIAPNAPTRCGNVAKENYMVQQEVKRRYRKYYRNRKTQICELLIDCV